MGGTDDGEGGYFEAIQTPTGVISLGGIFPGHIHSVMEQMSSENFNLTLQASDEAGWQLSLEGHIIPSHTGFRISGGLSSTRIVLLPDRIRAIKSPFKAGMAYLLVRFAFTNILLRDSALNSSSHLTFDINGFTITLKPTETYPETAERLRAIPGVEHTIFCELTKANNERLSMEEAENIIEVIVVALRLWSGNKTDWLYAEALDDSGSQVIERLHRQAVTGTYSNVLQTWGLLVDLVELAQAVSTHSLSGLEWKEFREFVNYFVDVCVTAPYLEIRGLTAATLLDTLAARYAAAQEIDFVMPENDYVSQVLPSIRDTIEHLPLTKTVKQQLQANVQGAWRTSFSKRLKAMNDTLSLGMSSQFRNQAKRVRDKLVHEGHFPDEDSRLKWESFKKLLWIDFVTLCRATGYSSQLPNQP